MCACYIAKLFQLHRLHIVIENMEIGEIHLIGGALTVRNSEHNDGEELRNT